MRILEQDSKLRGVLSIDMTTEHSYIRMLWVLRCMWHRYTACWYFIRQTWIRMQTRDNFILILYDLTSKNTKTAVCFYKNSFFFSIILEHTIILATFMSVFMMFILVVVCWVRKKINGKMTDIKWFIYILIQFEVYLPMIVSLNEIATCT